MRLSWSSASDSNYFSEAAARAGSCPGTAVIIRLQLTRKSLEVRCPQSSPVVTEIPLQNRPTLASNSAVFAPVADCRSSKSLFQIDVSNQFKEEEVCQKLVRSSVIAAEPLAAKN